MPPWLLTSEVVTRSFRRDSAPLRDPNGLGGRAQFSRVVNPWAQRVQLGLGKPLENTVVVAGMPDASP